MAKAIFEAPNTVDNPCVNGLESRTHCKNGHIIADVGIWESGGRRQCKECHSISTRKAQQAFRERQAK